MENLFPPPKKYQPVFHIFHMCLVVELNRDSVITLRVLNAETHD